MELLFKTLDHFCTTGAMLKRDTLLAGIHSLLHKS
jgi:hypothetical protein